MLQSYGARIIKNIIDKYGSVSPECCRAMVQGLSKISKSKINISITGIAGPNGGTKDKPVGLVYIGLKKGNKTIVSKNYFVKKKRKSVQNKTVEKCIKLIQEII